MKLRILPPDEMLDTALTLPPSKSMSVRAVAMAAAGAAYDGHYSWIYTLRDECVKVQATTGSGEEGAFVLADISESSTATVKLTPEGEAVSLWGWIAAQAKTAG